MCLWCFFVTMRESFHHKLQTQSTAQGGFSSPNALFKKKKQQQNDFIFSPLVHYPLKKTKNKEGTAKTDVKSLECSTKAKFDTFILLVRPDFKQGLCGFSV